MPKTLKEVASSVASSAQWLADIEHLEKGMVSCCLLDYMDFKCDRWIEWFRGNTSNKYKKSIRIMKLMFSSGRAVTADSNSSCEDCWSNDASFDEETMEFYYIIHLESLEAQLQAFKSAKCLNDLHRLVNVDPSLSAPELIDRGSQLYDQVESTLNQVCQSIETVLLDENNSDTIRRGIYTIDLTGISPSLDTCMINGWLLMYPFIYVHGQLFNNSDLEFSRRNCLSLTPLCLVKISHKNSSTAKETTVRQFTIPLCVLPQDSVKSEYLKLEVLQRFQQDFLCHLRFSRVECLSVML